MAAKTKPMRLSPEEIFLVLAWRQLPQEDKALIAKTTEIDFDYLPMKGGPECPETS